MLRIGGGLTSVPSATPRPSPPHLGRIAAHLLYDAALLAFLVGGSPYLLYKLLTTRRFRAGLAERFGFVRARPGERPCLWIHGVSVGEIKAARPLADALAARHPGLEVAFSATTESGFALASRLYADRFRFYYPLDLPLVPGRVLRRVRPRWIVLMELEIWPNFLRAARLAGVPIAVVNGRISERSWRGYRRARRLLPQLDRIALFCVQSRRYAERFLDLGVRPERVVVTGNMKFDNAPPARSSRPDPEWRNLLGVGENEAVVVGGSTHEPEERALLRAARAAGSRTGRAIRLVVAPRHPERVSAIAQALAQEGGSSVSLTALRAGAPAPPGSAVLVDTIGDLERIYALADLVFVGGSLVRHGGQNLLEPAGLGRPVIVGPHTFNFEDETASLLEAGAARRVADEGELLEALADLLGRLGEAAAMGDRAVAVIEANRGATERTVEAIEATLFAGRGEDDARPVAGHASRR